MLPQGTLLPGWLVARLVVVVDHFGDVKDIPQAAPGTIELPNEDHRGEALTQV
ncbi:MAG: hypothetical protein ACYDFQ_03580 [Vulcanimicrobiaceae bacterium]